MTIKVNLQVVKEANISTEIEPGQICQKQQDTNEETIIGCCAKFFGKLSTINATLVII